MGSVSTQAATTPVPFVIRLNVLVLITYPVLQIAAGALQLSLSMRRAGARARGFPARKDPLVQLALVVAYAAMPVVWVINPAQISGRSFWAVAGIVMWAGVAVFFASSFVFAKWRDANVILQSGNKRDKRTRITYRACARIVGVFQRATPNPLLIKNLVRSGRDEAVVSRSIITFVFVVVAYGIAMNNASMQDAVTVLFWIFSVYAFFVVLTAMNRLGAEDESPTLIHSLPITQAQFYLSMFLPVTGWLASIALVLAVMVVVAGGGMALAARFVMQALLASLILCSIGVSFAVGSYPSREQALTRFLGWMLGLAVLAVIFYKYRALTTVVAILGSLGLLVRTRFYKA
jgi:hypothetical protein